MHYIHCTRYPYHAVIPVAQWHNPQAYMHKWFNSITLAVCHGLSQVVPWQNPNLMPGSYTSGSPAQPPAYTMQTDNTRDLVAHWNMQDAGCPLCSKERAVRCCRCCSLNVCWQGGSQGSCCGKGTQFHACNHAHHHWSMHVQKLCSICYAGLC